MRNGKGGRFLAKGIAAILVFAAAATARAAGHDEAAGGDLSNNRLVPTRFTLEVGAPGPNGLAGNNVFAGTTGRSAGVVDRDYFTVVVPPGHVLAALLVGNQTTSAGAGGSFIAVAAGAVMPVADNAGSAAGLLGWRHYGVADRGSDILPAMGLPAQGSSGFTAPLPAGEYTFWVQELATGSYAYRFNLLLAPVPEPSAPGLLAAGLALVGLRLRRIRRG